MLTASRAVLDGINLTAAQTKGSFSRTVLLNERMQAEIAYLQSITFRDIKQALFASRRSAAFTANSLTQV